MKNINIDEVEPVDIITAANNIDIGNNKEINKLKRMRSYEYADRNAGYFSMVNGNKDQAKRLYKEINELDFSTVIEKFNNYESPKTFGIIITLFKELCTAIDSLYPSAWYRTAEEARAEKYRTGLNMKMFGTAHPYMDTDISEGHEYGEGLSKAEYLELAKTAHPDKGGTIAAFQALQKMPRQSITKATSADKIKEIEEYKAKVKEIDELVKAFNGDHLEDAVAEASARLKLALVA